MTHIPKWPPKAVSFKRAMDMMHLTGTRLVKMTSRASPDGFAHYIIPGGYVEPATAQRIKDSPGVYANDDGLFPGHDQTWMMKTST